MRRVLRARFSGLVFGIIVGALVILAIRFATYKVDAVHYHANFAVIINGQREKFSGSGYYEEETACKVGDKMVPVDRAHMHDKINDVVHVHDHTVTWGQFFNNLGWGIGINYIENHGIIYQNSGDNVLYVELNGQNLTGLDSIANRVIGDRDKLLIDFGPNTSSNATLEAEYNAIPNTAKQHDQEDDPATCSGPSVTTFHDRLTHLF